MEVQTGHVQMIQVHRSHGPARGGREGASALEEALQVLPSEHKISGTDAASIDETNLRCKRLAVSDTAESCSAVPYSWLSFVDDK